jgi:cytoskeletal protein CcmA (bactofilin family)
LSERARFDHRLECLLAGKVAGRVLELCKGVVIEYAARAAPAQTTTHREESSAMAMLKREEFTTTPAPAAPASDLLLGRGARFEGKLTFEGTVRIDATFVGSIITNDVLVVGEAARMDANITCGTIVVHGEVNGNIQAKTAVDIRNSGKVRGDLDTASLIIEKGALFQGACRMEQPKAATPKATAVSN